MEETQSIASDAFVSGHESWDCLEIPAVDPACLWQRTRQRQRIAPRMGSTGTCDACQNIHANSVLDSHLVLPHNGHHAGRRCRSSNEIERKNGNLKTMRWKHAKITELFHVPEGTALSNPVRLPKR
jgi:hypothetical protein